MTISLDNLTDQEMLGLAVIAGLATCSVIDLEAEIIELFDQLAEDLAKILTA